MTTSRVCMTRHGACVRAALAIPTMPLRKVVSVMKQYSFLFLAIPFALAACGDSGSGGGAPFDGGKDAGKDSGKGGTGGGKGGTGGAGAFGGSGGEAGSFGGA